MTLSNFAFFKDRVTKRNARRKSGEWFFLCYIFKTDGSFIAIRNDVSQLNKVNDTEIRYFEGIWDDRLNHRWFDDTLNAAGLAIHNMMPNHNKLFHGRVRTANPDDAELMPWCQCEQCEAQLNAMFYIDTTSVRECTHDATPDCYFPGNPDWECTYKLTIEECTDSPSIPPCGKKPGFVCPCNDVVIEAGVETVVVPPCTICMCVTYDAGYDFMRMIGIKGLSYWYNYRFDTFDAVERRIKQDETEYEAHVAAEKLSIGNECNSLIIQLESAIKSDFLEFTQSDESSGIPAMRDNVPLHRSNEKVIHDCHFNIDPEWVCPFELTLEQCIKSDSMPICGHKVEYIYHRLNQPPVYRIEGQVKDRYESFVYEWRQAIINFRNDFEIYCEGYTV